MATPSVAFSLHAGDLLRPSVVLDDGKVVGTTSLVPSNPHLRVNKFLGVPFAKSPPLRFTPPENPTPWNSTWDATYFRPSCFQHFPGKPHRHFCTDKGAIYFTFINTTTAEDFERIFNSPPLPESEDCLYLNVFTPSTPPPKTGFPVLFWIHGGSFQLGSARVLDYDGSSIAANQGLIVVSINYRLNGQASLRGVSNTDGTNEIQYSAFLPLRISH